MPYVVRAFYGLIDSNMLRILNALEYLLSLFNIFRFFSGKIVV